MKSNKAKVTTLKNGLRIVTEKKDFNKVTLGMWIRTGLMDEIKDNNGISHFLEHMMFKGTKTKSAKDLVEDIEFLGGSTNAYTGESVTAYHVTILSKYWKQAVDFLADILINSIFPADELEKERNVILQEYNNSMDDPNSIASYNLFEDIYKDQPLGRKILGTVENINKFTREDLIKYKNLQYTAKNMVFSVHGNINHKEIVDYCKEKFNSIPAGNENKVKDNKFNNKQICKHINKKIQQSYVFITREGLSSINTSEQDHYLEAIFNTILNGGMSCRLFQEVREKHGLGYHISQCNMELYNTGIFGIFGIVEPKDVDKLIEVSEEVLNSMKNSITEKELEKAKNTVLSSIAGANDALFYITESNALSLLLRNKLTNWDYIINFINNVKIEDIYEFSKKYLTKEYVLSITTPK